MTYFPITAIGSSAVWPGECPQVESSYLISGSGKLMSHGDYAKFLFDTSSLNHDQNASEGNLPLDGWTIVIDGSEWRWWWWLTTRESSPMISMMMVGALGHNWYGN